MGWGCGKVADLPRQSTNVDTSSDTASDSGTQSDSASDTTVVDTAADTFVDPDPSWHITAEALPAAMLSVWGTGTGTDEVWFVGADAGDATGPWAVRANGSAMARVDLRPVDARGGHLWWVFGPPDTSGSNGANAAPVYMSGEHGRLFAYDRATDAVRRIETETEATLYGVWGAGDGRLWAVGGSLRPATGPPVIVQIDRVDDTETTSLVTLPSTVGDDIVFFKVWGSAADDVYVIGEQGNLLHYDGAVWTHRVLPDSPRLVTIHGRNDEDVVIVGGTNQAIILEKNADGDFDDASPGPFALLNGVFMKADGDAVAAGIFGQVFRRTAGLWVREEGIPVQRDWHATWVDARGDIYVVGGNLLSADALDEGTILRFGLARDDAPMGAVEGLEPPMTADEGADDADVTMDDTSDVTPDTVEDTAPTDTTVDDTAADTVDDTAMDSLGDTAADTTPARTDYLDLGTATFDNPESFAVVAPNETIEIINGGQGLIHLEVALRYDYPVAAAESRLVTAIVIETFIDDLQVGFAAYREYPTKNEGAGLFQTEPLTVIFNTVQTDLYIDQTALIRAQITLPDNTVRMVEQVVVLVNDF